MKQAFFILITALFLFLIDNNQLEAQISLADSLQLVDLYNATNGDNWTNNSGWLTEPIAEWRGIKLDSLDASKIIAINLPENNLEGDLIDLQLPDLQALRFYTNQLSGEVLDFTNLPKLEILRLDLNRLSGEIPDFNFLPKLKLINLTNNLFIRGPIPDFSNLPELEALYLHENKLEDTIPNFSNLPELKVLYLRTNRLTGTIPDFSNLPKLESLALYDNRLSGSIPDFNNLPNLKGLGAWDNQLSGTIPDFSNLPNLEGLSLWNNQLIGTIPDFSNLPNLETLALSDNQFIGTIPNFSNLPKLLNLSLGGLNIEGGIPDFDNMPLLVRMHFDDTPLTGQIPNFSNLPSLIFIDANECQLTGPIPDFTNCLNLKEISAHDNQLNGAIPDFKHLQKLEQLSLYNNELTGSIPPLNDIPTLIKVQLGNNFLTGAIPPIDLPNLKILRLQNNQLEGFNSFNAPQLEVLVIQNSQIIHLPDLDCPNLTELGVHYNRLDFTDIVPNIGKPSIFPYSPQANIPIVQINDSTLSVSAGGTLFDNTYTWYKNNELFQEINGDSTLQIDKNGIYHCEVTNSVAIYLTLSSGERSITTFPCGPSDPESDCVWSGDTDKNGEVNIYDLMNIGLSFNNIGLARSEQTIFWQPYFSQNWEGTFSNGLNHKHADVNGDGVINEEDTEAILNNFLQTHDYPATSTNNEPPQKTEVIIKHDGTIIEDTEEIYSIWLGTPENPLLDVHGIAFKVRVLVADSTMRINEPILDFSDSWLGLNNANTVTIDTVFQKTDNEWVWHIAATRTDGTSISGSGELCRLLCVMDVVEAKDNKTSDLDGATLGFTMQVEDMLLTQHTGVQIPLNDSEVHSMNLTIDKTRIVGTEIEPPTAPTLITFPNPLHQGGLLHINTPYSSNNMLDIYDVCGQQRFQKRLTNKNTSIHLSHFPVGIYLIEIVDLLTQEREQEKLLVVE